MDSVGPIVPVVLLVCYFGWRLVQARRTRRLLPRLLAGGAQVIDVRSRAEFAAGHAAGSLNIPLSEIASRSTDLDRARAVVVCCASGVRSGLASRWLQANGFRPVLNAGSWRNLP